MPRKKPCEGVNDTPCPFNARVRLMSKRCRSCAMREKHRLTSNAEQLQAARENSPNYKRRVAR